MQQRNSITPLAREASAPQPAPVVAIHQDRKQLATTQVDGHSLANVDGHNSTSVAVHAARKAAARTPAHKLEQARQRVREALRLAADEAPSYAVLDDIARGLSLAMRDLEEAAMAVAVLQRREAQS
jgi:membrane-bound ClpP family serine protease